MALDTKETVIIGNTFGATISWGITRSHRRAVKTGGFKEWFRGKPVATLQSLNKFFFNQGVYTYREPNTYISNESTKKK